MPPLPAPAVDAMLWREYRPAKQRLRIGILVDDWRVPDWMFQAIHLLASEPALHLAALLKHREALPAPLKRSPLFNLLQGASRKVADPEHPLHDLSQELSTTPRLDLSEIPELDILIRFDTAVLRGPSKGLARMGVWSVGLGDSPQVPYLPEVRDQKAVSLLTLRHHPESLEKARGFYIYVAPTLQGWYFTRNAVEPLGLAGVLLVDRLLDVAANGYDPVVCRGDSEIGPAYDHTNLACLGMVARQSIRSVGGRLRARGRGLRWVTALRHVKDDAFREVQAPAGHGYADPFLIESNGRDYLLLEDVPRGGRGRLAAMEIAPGGDIGAPEIIMERPYHVSYPFVFRHGADVFLIPESAENKTVQLYRAGARAPFEWHFEKNLFEGPMLVDTTVFHHEGRWYFFTTQVDCGMRGYLFHAATLDGAWEYHPRNPICSDVSRCRGAGALFYRDGRLIRPAQDCSVRYGYAIVLNEVRRLSPTEYEEQAIERLEPSWWGRGNLGTHTLNANARWEVTDGLRLML